MLSQGRSPRFRWYIICTASVFFGWGGVPTGKAKLGETLPELIKRFGKEYLEEGTETEGNLKYKFRSAAYSVDALMSRQGNKLVSNVEIYYSDKPLQANGEPPLATVRGVMNVTAPGAKWRETPPVGNQRAAFVTADGNYLAAILPPDKSVDEHATFTVAIGKIGQIAGATVAQQRSSGLAGPRGGETAAPPPQDHHAAADSVLPAQAPDALAVVLPTGKVVHFQTQEEKSNYEAAMTTVSVPVQAAAETPPPPLSVVAHLTRNGVEMLRLSDGNIAVRAQLEVTAYENNEIAADQSFKGQRQPIFGTIDSFGVDILGYPYVILDRSDHGIVGVQCTFSKEYSASLATLQKGQIIAVAGKHNGKLFNVQVSECALIPWSKFDYDAPEPHSAPPVPRRPR